MTKETGQRIAVALEAIAGVLCSLAADGAVDEDPLEAMIQTQQGPMVMRDGKLVPVE